MPPFNELGQGHDPILCRQSRALRTCRVLRSGLREPTAQAPEKPTVMDRFCVLTAVGETSKR